MTVYEVMFIAIPLWLVLVGVLFSLVFGWDAVGYFKSKSAAQAAAAPYPARAAAVEETAPRYHEEPATKGERELVYH